MGRSLESLRSVVKNAAEKLGKDAEAVDNAFDEFVEKNITGVKANAQTDLMSTSNTGFWKN